MMEKVVNTEIRWSEKGQFIFLALMGCGLITVGSLIEIPLKPVPFTLQTLAIFILALTQSPKQVLASCLCYLTCASCNLPVLGGQVDSLWVMGATRGYLIAFPIAAYCIAYLRQKYSNLIALLCGQVIILLLGFCGLVYFVGYKSAFLHGVVLFIPSGILKAFAALALTQRKD